MVNLKKLEIKLEELTNFFSSIREAAYSSEDDRETADYGLKKVDVMQKLIRAYGTKPSNHILKRIHSSLSSVTRGVEGFSNDHLTEAFYNATKGIYDISKELEQNIRW